MSRPAEARVPAHPAPKMSIGMPVYNAQAWLAPSIEALLSQTFVDFELIISDNASSDGTYALCERYAQADPRIRLLRNPVNVGANRNYLATLAAARGVYFKWASSNDLCAPQFLARCIEALERDPDAALACPRTCLFERVAEDGKPYAYDIGLTDPDPAARFVALLNTLALNNAFNGVMRRAALQRALPMGTFHGADIVLMAELALLGKFVLLDERLFFRRMTSESATKLKSAQEVDRHLVPHARRPLQWQHWRYHAQLVRVACRSARMGRSWFTAVGYSLRALLWSRRLLAADVLRALQRTAW